MDLAQLLKSSGSNVEKFGLKYVVIGSEFANNSRET